MPDRTPEGPLTSILKATASGEAGTTERLISLVYDELRRLAREQLAHEAPGQTLQPTALVHEAYLRLMGDSALEWDTRGHFFAAAAQAMRRILVERARRRRRVRHGGGARPTPLGQAPEPEAIPDEDAQVVGLDEALTELEARDGRKGRIVMLRYFAGLTIAQTAAALDLSATTVKDEWTFARAWLQSEIRRRME